MNEPDLARLARLRERADAMAPNDGINPSAHAFFSVVRRRQHHAPVAAVLNPAFCLVLQGAKSIEWRELRVTCHPGQFLASGIEIPALVQVQASPEQPYLGLVVHFTTDEIAAIVVESGFHPSARDASCEPRFIGAANAEFLTLMERLLQLGATDDDQFRASLVKRELIFCLLAGPYSHLIAPKSLMDPRSGVLEAMSWIRRHFDRELVLDELAARCAMSTSSLGHKFKRVTGFSPVQYQKQLRLQQARRLLWSGNHDVGSAAYAVGYLSLSHFTREYARLFGLAPGRDRTTATRDALDAI